MKRIPAGILLAIGLAMCAWVILRSRNMAGLIAEGHILANADLVAKASGETFIAGHWTGLFTVGLLAGWFALMMSSLRNARWLAALPAVAAIVLAVLMFSDAKKAVLAMNEMAAFGSHSGPHDAPLPSGWLYFDEVAPLNGSLSFLRYCGFLLERKAIALAIAEGVLLLATLVWLKEGTKGKSDSPAVSA